MPGIRRTVASPAPPIPVPDPDALLSPHAFAGIAGIAGATPLAIRLLCCLDGRRKQDLFDVDRDIKPVPTPDVSPSSVVPLATRDRGLPHHVRIASPGSGLGRPGRENGLADVPRRRQRPVAFSGGGSASCLAGFPY